LDFLHNKTIENCENHQRSLKKYCFEIYDLSRATTPLNALKVLIVTHLPHDESRHNDYDRAESVRHNVEEDAAHVHVAAVRVTVAAAVGVTVRRRRFRGRRSLLRRVHDLKQKMWYKLKAGFRIRIQSGQWIRIRIRNPDPDPGEQKSKMTHKSRKHEEISCFEVLDVFF
jgi:hypothetical protein